MKITTIRWGRVSLPVLLGVLLWAAANASAGAPARPNRLPSGAELRPVVKATRQGRTLKLEYKLLDAAGRNWAGRHRAKEPRFTVYKGNRQIGSGSFRYG
jgi:hypothetical protein